MSLRTVVAAPFRQHGQGRLGESEFVVALSLDRDWFSPDQASRLVDVAVGEGLVSRDGNDVVAEFDPDAVSVPAGFEPGEELLRTPSAFERVLEELVAAGHEKQKAVAGINRLQADLEVTIEAAAVLYARRQGVAVERAAERARAELRE
ncbi:MAG: DUF2240 family protein [Halobacteriales archaeon]